MSKSLNYYKNYFTQVVVKSLLQKFPALFIAIQKFRYKGKRYSRKIVSKETDIVIEGYPRSANSFSVKAFKFANGEDYKIAAHLHAYPQITLGVKYNIPTLVLIRNPYDCIISYAALRADNIGVTSFNSNYNIKWILEDYVIFYENLLPYKNKIVVGVFSDVLSDFGKVIERVNLKFDTNFLLFNHTLGNVDKVFKTAKLHLSPSNKRDKVKKHFTEQINELKDVELFKRAEQLFLIWSTPNN